MHGVKDFLTGHGDLHLHLSAQGGKAVPHGNVVYFIMSYEEKVRWLRRYRDALRLEEELRQELEAQRARACKTTAALTGMPGGGGDGQALPRAVESIVAAQQELQAQINLCGATRREVVAVLDQVADARDHEILRRRYLLGQTYEKIAESLNISVRYCIKLHKACVQKVHICE